MQYLKGVQYTFSSNFGRSKTGKTVTASILDNDGSARGAGYTLGSVVELGGGIYSVTCTFTQTFNGHIKWEMVSDSLELYTDITIIEDYTTEISIIKKINVNRWKIESNQLKLYDDDATTVLYTFNLKKSGVANGETPDERVPA